MSTFAEVKILPMYGSRQAVVTWRLSDGTIAGDFFIFKSPDGVNDWVQIGQGKDIEHIVDTDFFSQQKLFQWYYRVDRLAEGKLSSSSIVGTFGAVTRHQFAAAKYIMDLEFTTLRRFTEIQVCKLRITAPACPACTVENTGQQIGCSMCLTCYGTGLEGGYFPGVQSYMRIMKNAPVAQNDSAEGAGSVDQVYTKGRMLSFPFLRKNDMIVDLKSDHRWLVETVDHAYIGGTIPVVAHDTNLLLLRTNDVRYKFNARG